MTNLEYDEVQPKIKEIQSNLSYLQDQIYKIYKGTFSSNHNNEPSSTNGMSIFLDAVTANISSAIVELDKSLALLPYIEEKYEKIEFAPLVDDSDNTNNNMNNKFDNTYDDDDYYN